MHNEIIEKNREAWNEALGYHLAFYFEQSDYYNKEIILDDFISYFKKGPYSYKSGLDYVGQIQIKT